jgi:hypothetical protein
LYDRVDQGVTAASTLLCVRYPVPSITDVGDSCQPIVGHWLLRWGHGGAPAPVEIVLGDATSSGTYHVHFPSRANSSGPAPLQCTRERRTLACKWRVRASQCAGLPGILFDTKMTISGFPDMRIQGEYMQNMSSNADTCEWRANPAAKPIAFELTPNKNPLVHAR